VSDWDEWDEWRPPFAPHVLGRYTRRVWDAEEGKHEPQTVTATCETCREVYGPTTCDSGRVRSKVDTFALGHLHRDAMDPRPILKLGEGDEGSER
jgi:hypothetical protein